MNKNWSKNFKNTFVVPFRGARVILCGLDSKDTPCPQEFDRPLKKWMGFLAPELEILKENSENEALPQDFWHKIKTHGIKGIWYKIFKIV